MNIQASAPITLTNHTRTEGIREFQAKQDALPLKPFTPTKGSKVKSCYSEWHHMDTGNLSSATCLLAIGTLILCCDRA